MVSTIYYPNLTFEYGDTSYITGIISMTGIANATSITLAGDVTGGAPAQRDILIRTGNNANPQVLDTRLTIGSNAALPAVTFGTAYLNMNSQNIENCSYLKGANVVGVSLFTDAYVTAGAPQQGDLVFRTGNALNPQGIVERLRIGSNAATVQADFNLCNIDMNAGIIDQVNTLYATNVQGYTHAGGNSLVLTGYLTGGAPDDNDIVFSTGNNANPQLSVERLRIASNSALPAITFGTAYLDMNGKSITNVPNVKGENAANSLALRGYITGAAPVQADVLISTGDAANPQNSITRMLFNSNAALGASSIDVYEDFDMNGNDILNAGSMSIGDLITSSVTGTANATSLTLRSNVTGGAPAQRDITIQTGNAANPQVLATRMTFNSNAAAGASSIDCFEELDMNTKPITNAGGITGTQITATTMFFNSTWNLGGDILLEVDTGDATSTAAMIDYDVGAAVAHTMGRTTNGWFVRMDTTAAHAASETNCFRADNNGVGTLGTVNAFKIDSTQAWTNYITAANFSVTGAGALTATALTSPTLTGTNAANSLTLQGYVTGAAPAQEDIIFKTGNAANPQLLVTRLTLGSNSALPTAAFSTTKISETCTLTAAPAAHEDALYMDITTAGASANWDQRGIHVLMNAGFTGTANSFGAYLVNQVIGAGYNFGGYGDSSGATAAGTNYGFKGLASNSSVANYGISGDATSNTAGATNCGVYGIATNNGGGASAYGGLFELGQSAGGAALVCDNKATSNEIFVVKDNGVPVFKITDGGIIIGQNSNPSIDMRGYASNAVPVQADVVFKTGNGANPQLASERIRIGSNANTVDIDISNANIDVAGNCYAYRFDSDDATFVDDFFGCSLDTTKWRSVGTTTQSGNESGGWHEIGNVAVTGGKIDWNDIYGIYKTENFRVEFRLFLDSTVNRKDTVGLGNAIGAGTLSAVSDGMFFKRSTIVDNNWHAVTVAGGVSTDTDTAVVGDTNPHIFAIETTDNGANIKFYIDGVLKATHNTNVTALGLQPAVEAIPITDTHYTELDFVKLWINRA